MLHTGELKRIRLKRGLTQAEAAEQAGVGSATWWNDVESGRRSNISLETLDHIAVALDCDPRDLIVPPPKEDRPLIRKRLLTRVQERRTRKGSK